VNARRRISRGHDTSSLEQVEGFSWLDLSGWMASQGRQKKPAGIRVAEGPVACTRAHTQGILENGFIGIDKQTGQGEIISLTTGASTRMYVVVT